MNAENVILRQRHTKEREAEQCRNRNDRPGSIIVRFVLMPRRLHGGQY